MVDLDDGLVTPHYKEKVAKQKSENPLKKVCSLISKVPREQWYAAEIKTIKLEKHNNLT